MTETMLVLQNITLVALTIVVTLNTVTIAKALNTPPLAAVVPETP